MCFILSTAVSVVCVLCVAEYYQLIKRTSVVPLLTYIGHFFLLKHLHFENMEPKSPNYEKLVNEKKSPGSPGDKKRLRFKFCRMLSSGNLLKVHSTPASPTTPQYSPQNFDFQSNSLESLRRSTG